MRRLAAFVAGVFLYAGVAFAAEANRDAAPKNIILVGWDAAQREHVHQCLDRGELPTIKALAAEGALVDIDVITGATDTKAGWTQILTGYDPEITGVFNNGRYQDVPAGYSVFERLKKQFGVDNFICAAVIGKKAHCGEINPPTKKRIEDGEQGKEGGNGKKGKKGKDTNFGNKPAQPRGEIVEENGVKYRVFGGSPYYTMHKSCNVWEFGLEEDQKVGSRVIELLGTYTNKPFFFFVHFATVDHRGHRFGENSKEYNDALISNDQWTGKIIDRLKELGLYDSTLVYVTADHGFDEGAKGHHNAPYVFLATNDPKVKRGGMRQDVAPTILSRFGVDLSTIDPPLSGESLTANPTKPVLKADAAKQGGGGKKKAGGKKGRQAAATQPENKAAEGGQNPAEKGANKTAQ